MGTLYVSTSYSPIPLPITAHDLLHTDMITATTCLHQSQPITLNLQPTVLITRQCGGVVNAIDSKSISFTY
jgi:hypothetical protein